MGVMTGENGAIYFNAAITDTATTGTLYFSSGGTILSSSSGGSGSTGAVVDFETEGYEANMLFTVSGCTYAVGSTGTSTTGNNQIITLTAVSSGQLSCTGDTLITSTSGEAGAVTLTEVEPGIEIGGCFNWTLTYAGDALETSAFDDSSGGRTFMGGLTNWSGSFDKYWLDANNRVSHYRSVSSTGGSWMGSTGIKLRLFTKYVATPSTGSPSQYWSGDATITGIDQSTPRDAVINQSIGFQGQGLLTLNTKTAAWNTTA